MSLILDALKKSDMERSRHKAPDIAAAGGGAPQQNSPRWLWPVVVLLLLNGAFLTYLLLKPGASDDAPVALVSTVQEKTMPLTIAQSPVSTVSAAATPPTQKADVRSLLDETIREAATQRERAAAAPAASVSKQTTGPQTTAPAQFEARESLPSFSDLRASGKISLEKMNLELHVYNDDPKARFAFINGQKTREGDRLNGGGRVVQITRFGVIVEHNGQRFELPRD